MITNFSYNQGLLVEKGRRGRCAGTKNEDAVRVLCASWCMAGAVRNEDTSSVSIKGCCHLPLKGKAYTVPAGNLPINGKAVVGNAGCLLAQRNALTCAALGVTTSSDLASLGHLPLKGKAYTVHAGNLPINEKTVVGNAGCLPLQGKVPSKARRMRCYR